MKKILTLIIASALIFSMSACGKKDEEKSHIVDSPGTVSQPKTDEEIDAMRSSMQPEGSAVPSSQPENEQAQPAAESNSSNVSQNTAQSHSSAQQDTDSSIPVAEEPETVTTADEFESREEPPEYMKYTSGDTKWGIVMPESAQIGDEDESGVLFLVDGGSLLMVQTMDTPVYVDSPEAVNEVLGQSGVEITDFSIINSGGEYAGCRYKRITPEGNEGYAKLLTNGSVSIAASAVNPEGTLTQELIDAVDSLVIFE